MKNVNILGGGLGGLSAAYYLLKKCPSTKISLFESTDRTGGWIKSKRLTNGVVFQQAARTIRPTGLAGINTLEMIKDLNLINEVVPISRTHPAAKNRMIYAQGKLTTLPSSLFDLFRTTPPFEKPLAMYLLHDLVAQKENKDDEPIYDFVHRRFGKEVADYLISPLVCGICAGDAKEISVKFLMDPLFQKEQAYGSITKGIFMDMFKKPFKHKEKNEIANFVKDENWSVYTFKDGLEVLPQALEQNIKEHGGEIKLSTGCNSIEFIDDKVLLTTDRLLHIDSDHLISSISAKTLADLVQKQHPDLSALLKKIPYVTVGVVNLHYNGKLPIKDAFGFLVPPCEKLPILGAIFDSCCLSDPNNTVLTVMMGGKWFETYFGTDVEEKQLLDAAVSHLNDILKITDRPDNYQVNILKDSIPQYVVGHSENIQKIETYIHTHKLPLTVCGFSYYGIGVNDVILSSKLAVGRF